MLYLFEHFGVALSAISGVLAARGKSVDLFGVIVLAVVTAFGGGTIRDLMLGDIPIFWVRDANFLLNAVTIAVLTFFVARVHHFRGNALLIADAFQLAFFTMIGVKKALAIPHIAPSVAVAMGVITGVAGGIIRDTMTGEIPLVFRREIYFYATAALVGAVVFSALQHWLPDRPANVIIGAAVTLLLRLSAIRWKLALPTFTIREKP
jgi:uncharacterized membrane protein YeiH